MVTCDVNHNLFRVFCLLFYGAFYVYVFLVLMHSDGSQASPSLLTDHKVACLLVTLVRFASDVLVAATVVHVKMSSRLGNRAWELVSCRYCRAGQINRTR